MSTELTHKAIGEMHETVRELIAIYHSASWPSTAEGDDQRQKMSDCLQRLRVAVATLHTESRTDR